MIGDQILTFRKAKGMTQEELAVKLHIVRQTVSKWEKGLSVPDAQMLIQLAKCLDVTVAQLLDVPPQTSDQLDLAKELEKANEALAQLQQRDAQIRRAGRVRNLILYVSFLALAAALIVRHEVISILLIGGFLVTAGVILYRNLALLTSLTTQDFRLEPLRAATIFNLILFLLVISIALLAAVNLLPPSERWEKCLQQPSSPVSWDLPVLFRPSCPITGTRDCGCPGPCRTRIHGIWRTVFSVLFPFP